jgi:hypothetical protein
MAATRLYFTETVETQWQEIAGPWLRAQAATAWKNPRPTVILTPTRAEGFYLRSRLVAEGIPYLGLRFWTPSDARQFLLAEALPELGSTSRAEERLIARACAENLADPANPDHAAITSVIREPGAFLRAYDLLLGAGWNPAREGADYGRDLARDLQRVLEKSHVATQAGLHRQLRRQLSAASEPLIAHLLVIGFNATHWPLWDLLQAVVRTSEQSAVALLNPRHFAQTIDQLWRGSWEETFQTEVEPPPNPVPPEDQPTPFSDLIASYEKGTSGPFADNLTFLVTPDLTSQVRAIALQAIAYLQQKSCTRLGIVFAEANALALGVASELRRLGIPLDDGIGLTTPGLFERRSWQTWLALQEEPGVPAMIAWLRACEAEGVSSGVRGQLTARDVAGALDGALGESLVDDLNFLALHLENSNRTNAGHVADFLRRRVVLPERATFARFLDLTRRAAELPGWENHLARLEIDPPAWLLANDQTFSRRTFLEWLKETTVSQAWTSGKDGNHFYGKVHLLIYAQMSGQTWSHLILTGLNEGIWPRIFEAGAFGSRHELVELNRQARALNVRSTIEGGQGSGHETVKAGHGYCLLPLERQDLALRDLCAALESTSHGASLAAMTTEGGRSLLPSDFFNHAWQSKMGHVLDEDTFRHLANATAAWCTQHDSLFSTKAAPVDPLLGDLPLFAQPAAISFATAAAYHARRDATQPFGPYEFAYARPPVRPIQLTCKRWEDALGHPAIVWLEDIVGTSAWPDGTMRWQRAIGTWTHRWLASAMREWQETKSAPQELPVFIWAAADRETQAVHRRARETELELYPWWEQVWAQARGVALGLGETLAPVLPDRPFLCEMRLPRNLIIALPGTALADFSLNGRIDLLLLEPGATPPDPVEPDLARHTCWVIDFKTGSAQKLAKKQIDEGRGLQPILYALAAQALGAVATSVSLHTVDAPLKPQVQLDNIVDTATIFRSLDILHRDGIFGMRADADNAYRYAPSYPMATRFIPGTVLDAKWALVHGGAPVPVGGADA